MTTAPYLRFSAAEFARRHAAARALMGRLGADVLVVYGNSGVARHNHAEIHYLSGFLGNRNNFVVFPAAAPPVLFVQAYNHVQNAAEVSAIDTRWGGRDSAQAVVAYVREVAAGPGVLGYVGDVPVQAYLTWQRELVGWELRDVTADFRALRLVKSAEELDWLRRGAALTDTALATLAARVKPGMREYELGAVVEECALSRGGLPHLYYLSSGPQEGSAVCVPRQTLSARVIEAGDVVNTEISVSYGGYSGQAHRPIFVAAEPTDLYRRLFDVALEAYTAVAGVLRAGASTEAVLDAAEVIHARGFTINDEVLHGFGIGLLPPTLGTRRAARGPQAPFTFAADMCVVVQPNVVTPDERAGVQLGNLLRITDTGAECLHRLPLRYFVAR